MSNCLAQHTAQRLIFPTTPPQTSNSLRLPTLLGFPSISLTLHEHRLSLHLPSFSPALPSLAQGVRCSLLSYIVTPLACRAARNHTTHTTPCGELLASSSPWIHLPSLPATPHSSQRCLPPNPQQNFASLDVRPHSQPAGSSGVRSSQLRLP